MIHNNLYYSVYTNYGELLLNYSTHKEFIIDGGSFQFDIIGIFIQEIEKEVKEFKSKPKYLEFKTIYLIKQGRKHNTYKIGITNNMRKRLSALQNGNSDKLEIIFQRKCFYAFLVEKKIKNFFDDLNLRGEWFRLNDENVDLVCWIIDIFGESPLKRKFEWRY